MANLIPSVEGFRKINVDCLQSISVDFFCQIFTICNAGNLDRKIIDSEIGNSSKYPNFESSASNFLFRIGSLVWSENAANMGIVEVALKKVEQQGTLLLKQINSFKKEIKSKIWRKFLGDISEVTSRLGLCWVSTKCQRGSKKKEDCGAAGKFKYQLIFYHCFFLLQIVTILLSLSNFDCLLHISVLSWIVIMWSCTLMNISNWRVGWQTKTWRQQK